MITSFNHNRNSQPNKNLPQFVMKKILFHQNLGFFSFGLYCHYAYFFYSTLSVLLSRQCHGHIILTLFNFIHSFHDCLEIVLYFLYWEGRKKTYHENIQTTEHANSFTHIFVKLAKTTTDYKLCCSKRSKTPKAKKRNLVAELAKKFLKCVKRYTQRLQKYIFHYSQKLIQ